MCHVLPRLSTYLNLLLFFLKTYFHKYYDLAGPGPGNRRNYVHIKICVFISISSFIDNFLVYWQGDSSSSTSVTKLVVLAGRSRGEVSVAKKMKFLGTRFLRHEMLSQKSVSFMSLCLTFSVHDASSETYFAWYFGLIHDNKSI